MQAVIEPIKLQLKRDLKRWEEKLGQKSEAGLESAVKKFQLKLDKEVFIKTNFEKKCVSWIKKALTIFNDGMLDIRNEMRKQDKRNKRDLNSKVRHCEICRRVIKVGKKYCYKCRKLKR